MLRRMIRAAARCCCLMCPGTTPGRWIVRWR